jgi:hypothetical protein
LHPAVAHAGGGAHRGKSPFSKIAALGLFDKLIAMKMTVPNDRTDMLDTMLTDITRALSVFA